MFKARYEIVPVGKTSVGRKAVPPSATAPFLDAQNKPRYEGAPIQLFFCGEPFGQGLPQRIIERAYSLLYDGLARQLAIGRLQLLAQVLRRQDSVGEPD